MANPGESSCIFCRIVAKSIPASIVLEDDDIVAFRDARPVAPVHVLVVPRRHIAGVADMSNDDQQLFGRILLGARDVAAKLGLSDEGYRLVLNQGAAAGQSVLHVHCHVLGGRELAWPPG